MKKLLFVIALMAVTVIAAEAQQRKQRPDVKPEDMAERMTNRMAEELDLDETQKKAVYELNLESVKQRMEARDQAKEDRDEMREKMEADRKEHEEKLEAILTPEQTEKWKEFQKESREKMRERGARGQRRGDG
ncbi:DUF4890 domain-containing protein [Echinicola sp. 20G]|uniref:DUF4890 domain-containing protein n=1 Tax=Echinicola sp. 20G TaxID=2781961 RepID=UPI00190FDCCD|nr:DUF4890 domain-containing protein [Echinicola sp. 20G]